MAPSIARAPISIGSLWPGFRRTRSLGAALVLVVSALALVLVPDARPAGADPAPPEGAAPADLAPAAAVPVAGTVTTTAVPGADEDERYMSFVEGPDGGLWCTVPTRGAICRVTESGLTTYTDPAVQAPMVIAAGTDGALWFSMVADAGVGRVTVDGRFTVFPGTAGYWVESLLAGPDGTMWFTTYFGQLGRITADGVVSTVAEFPDRTGRLAQGDDGAVWVSTTDSLERFAAGGVRQTFRRPGTEGWQNFAPGRDGAVWVVTYSGRLSRMDADGSWTDVSTPGLGAVRSVIWGEDGALWYLRQNPSDNQLARVTPAGIVSTFADPHVASPYRLYAGPGGSLVFANAPTLPAEHRIGRVQTTGAPARPRQATATAVAGGATVSWQPSPADGGSPITGYTVTAAPGGRTCTWTAGPLACTVTGLTPSTLYAFTVAATNAIGTGTASDPTTGVVIPGPPPPPTNVRASAGVAGALVSWDPPAADGGSPVTAYTVRAWPGGRTCDVAAPYSSCFMDQLAIGVPHTFTVTATNARGTSPDSTPSEPVVAWGAPSAPENVRAVPGPGFVTVYWDPPADSGGVPVMSYHVVNESQWYVCNAAPPLDHCAITGLPPDDDQSFLVYAINEADHWGPASAPTAAVTALPNAAGSPFGSPFGSIDVIAAAGGTVSLSGWAIDPATSDPVTVQVSVDGQEVGTARAGASRRDVGYVFPLFGPDHGYAATVAASAGSHEVCITVVPLRYYISPWAVGCRSVVVPSGSPFGSVDAVGAPGSGSLSVAGWALDPDSAGSTSVEVYVDGQHRGFFPADGPRGDVARAYPGFGVAHGYGVSLAVAGGPHTVCVYADNIGPGANATLGCGSVVVPSGSPFGAVDVVSAGVGSVSLAGWALDPDSVDPTSVEVYVDGQHRGFFPANGSRPDVAAAYPGLGVAHGYGVSLAAAGGRHTVCVYADNIGPGANTTLGCGSVVVPSGSPFGSVDGASASPGSVSVAGWALDPDSVDPTSVEVYVDGQHRGFFPANGSRPDVAAAYPGYGAAHGYGVSLPAAAGGHTVCVYADNIGPGANTTLGCRSVTVPAA
jgi:hypothetical protein